MPFSSRPSRRIINDEDIPFSPDGVSSMSHTHPNRSDSRTTGTPGPMRPPLGPLPPAPAFDDAPSDIHLSSPSIAKRFNHLRVGRPMNRFNGSKQFEGNMNGNVNSPRELLGIRSDFVSPSQEQEAVSLQYKDLVKSILEHPAFPLVFCGVYEASTGTAPVISNTRAQKSLAEATSNCQQLEAYVHKVGVSTACTSSDSIEVFMCGLISAMNALNNPRAPSIPAPLHDTIRACGNQPQIPMVEPTPIPQMFNSSSGSEIPLPYHQTSNVPPIIQTSRPKLNESAKKYLENWFNEHFENPYPTDAEKKKMARECGLRVNQVNNWFGESIKEFFTRSKSNRF